MPLRSIVFSPIIKEWCKLPYGKYKLKSGETRYTNPNGCVMYGTRAECPPEAKMVDDILDLSYYKMINSVNFVYRELMDSKEPNLFLIYQEFDLEAQAKRMKGLHLDWSEKQCRCCRYYQRGLDKRIEEEANKFIRNKSGYIILERPEANGVNLFSTCRLHDIELGKEYLTQEGIIKMVITGPEKQKTISRLEKVFSNC